MLSKKIFLSATTVVVLLSALIQPVLAQSRTVNSSLSDKATFSRNTLVRGQAALLGPVEVSLEQQEQPKSQKPTSKFNIGAQQKVLLTPGAPLPGQVGPGNTDRGVQVQINKP